MKKLYDILKKFPLKFLGTVCLLSLMLLVFYLSCSIPISLGFFLDIIFIIGLTSLIYFAVGSNLIKNIIFTIIGSLLTILYIVDHIYYSNFNFLSSINSLNNAGMVMDNMDAYGVKLDLISILFLIILAGLICFLFIYKNKDKKFKERVFYSIPIILIFVPFIITYIVAYNDFNKLSFLINKSYPGLVQNFGYLIYRYEDIAIQIDANILNN